MATMIIRSLDDIKKITATKSTRIERVSLVAQDSGYGAYPTTIIDWKGNHPQNGKIIAGTGRFIDLGYVEKAPSTQSDFVNWFRRHWNTRFSWIDTGNWSGIANDPYGNGRRYPGLKTFLISKIGKAKHIYGIVKLIDEPKKTAKTIRRR